MTKTQEPAVYHPEHHHFYRRNAHLFKRLGRVMISGTGFLADAYDLFVINVALLMMKQPQNQYHVKLTPDIQGSVSMMAIVGAMTGQMIFGFCGDEFGRKNTFIVTAALVILGTVAQVCAQPVDGYWHIYRQLMLFRFLMGVGIGGEYPLSSSITSESSEDKHRGRNLAAVFSMQGFGRVLCATVLLFSAFVIKDTNWQWRFAILMGAVPMLVSIYFRFVAFPETEIYIRDVKSRSQSLKERVQNICTIVWANKKKLAGTAGAWFILDVLFYGNSLFSADITRAMGIEQTIQGKALQNLYIQLIALPGYLFGVAFMDVVGRKRLQLFGFAGEAVVFAIMAAFLSQIKLFKGLFIVLYALTFFFDDFGPNLTTFVIPATIYPTEVRSTCHGISAAFGKAGAAFAAKMFLRLKDFYCPNDFCDKHAPQELVDKGLRLTFMVCSGLAVLGFVWTLLLVTDKTDKSLKDAESIYDIESEKEHAQEMKEIESAMAAVVTKQ